MYSSKNHYISSSAGATWLIAHRSGVHLAQDSRAIERLQRKATKYTLIPYLDYESKLVNLSILPLTLWLEFREIVLLIKLIKDPPDNFQLNQYINSVL